MENLLQTVARGASVLGPWIKPLSADLEVKKNVQYFEAQTLSWCLDVRA